ncbi:MAG TPA: adenosylcobinamide-GDP ribazoletransferase [Anaerovoracaceae bacterium]|nr:adenosylcobinamide-GDP ribazoletransferase [Anaerovoracaceae bacterium]
MKYIHAFFMSLGMFSSIPCPYRPWDEKARRLMLVFLPPVGLLIGLIWYGLYLLLGRIDLLTAGRIDIPLQLQTAVLMLYPYLITGFIHLDGFMDTSDALLSRRPLEDKLRILKDPHTGAFAVISAAVLFIVCFGSMSAAVEQLHLKQALDIATDDPMPALILVPVVTRCCSAIAVLAGKPLAHSQYQTEEGTKKPAAELAAISLMGLAAILTAFWHSWSVPLVLAGALAAYLAAMFGAVRQLAGVSGDLAGYALTVGEGAALVMLALLA